MAEPSNMRIEVQGLSCAGCAGRAERALGTVAGVSHASVNFANGTAQMSLNGAEATEIVAAFKTDDAVTAFVEGLGRGKTAHAAADDSDSLSVDHAHVPFA